MSWILLLLIGILVVLAITAATGYFVAQEFAYMAVDRSRLRARAAEGDRGAERALTITNRTSFMLSGAQLGITVTGLLVGYTAEPLIGDAVGEALGGVGVPQAVGVGIGVALALILSTLIQMLFGELFPKNLAIARPEPLAIWLARSTQIYLALFGWLIAIFDASSNALLRLLKIEPVHDVEQAATSRDLKHIVADSRESGELSFEESLLLDRILDFPHRDVAHAMVARARTDVVEEDATLGEVRELMRVGHSRYPVVSEEEEVVGIVDLPDVLASDAQDSASVTSLMRPAVFIPETMPLPVAVQRLHEQRSKLAVVVDEYGGFAGIVTTEDLGEELVGDVADEHDDTIERMTPEGENVWSAPGDIPLDEVERTLLRTLPESGATTLGGLMLEQTQEFVEAGEKVRITLPLDPELLVLADPPEPAVIEVEVVEVERHVPSRVVVRLEEER